MLPVFGASYCPLDEADLVGESSAAKPSPYLVRQCERAEIENHIKRRKATAFAVAFQP